MNSGTEKPLINYLLIMKSASTSAAKWAQNAQNGAQNYVSGVENTTKDPMALASAASGTWQQAVTAPGAVAAFKANTAKVGKAGWQAGVQAKGAQNYGTGVASQTAQTKYEQNSGKYDSARSAAAAIARGPRGSAGNLSRVAAVMNAERKVKTGG